MRGTVAVTEIVKQIVDGAATANARFARCIVSVFSESRRPSFSLQPIYIIYITHIAHTLRLRQTNDTTITTKDATTLTIAKKTRHV